MVSNNKYDLINQIDSQDIDSWIKKFTLSKLSSSDKIDILKINQDNFKKINTGNISSQYKLFLDLVINEKYCEALKLSKYLSYFLPEKQCEVEKIIKNKNIYFLSPKLEIEMGGLGRTVLYRANYLAQEGYNVTLLNIGPVKNYEYVIDYFKDKNLFSNNIKFINIFDYYSQKNASPINKPSMPDELDENVIKKENSDNSTTLTYFDNSEIIKSEIYIEDCLVYEECGEFNKYYTKDGFNYLTNDKINKKFILNEKLGIKFEFKDNLEFLYHFLDEICLNKDKPFIVCDATSHWYDANGIDLKDAYKIGSMHGSPFKGFNPKNEISPKIKHLKHFDNINRLVILTHDLKHDLEKLYDPNKLVVIPNFVFEKNLEYEPVEKDINNIGIYSRISPEKQISHAIKAFDIVSKHNENAVLEIYGGASNPYEEKEYEKIKDLVKQLKLEDRVIFKGFSSNINEPMRKSLITLLTSKHEGLPLSILESMTNSTAVISYDCYYGPKELITDNVDGILIKKNNINQLAEAILNLLDNPDLAIEMGKKGKEKIINEYTLSKIGPKWKKLFIDVYIESEIKDFIEEITIKDKYCEIIAKNNSLTSQNKKLKSENNKLKKFKKEILSSTSWKITEPLRKLMKIFKK